MPLFIALFYGFYFALIGVYVIFIPKILAMEGMNGVEIGFILSAAPLVRFGVPFLFLRGFHLAHNTFYLSLFLMLLGAVGFYPALHHFWGLLGVNIVFGIGIALILPYIEVIALECIGREKYGKFRLFGSIGFITVALLLGKYLTEGKIGIDYLMVMALVTALFGMIIGRKHPKTHPSSYAKENSLSFTPLHHPYLWIGFLLMQISFAPFYTFFTLYTTDHGLSLDTTVWLWSFGVIAEIIMFYFQGSLLRRNLYTILWITALLTAFRWLLVALFPDSIPLLLFAQSLHAFGFALFYTAAISVLFHLYTARHLAQQFFFGISYGLGGFVGTLVSGYVYHAFPQYLFGGAATVALGSTLAFYVHAKKTP